ncbi:MAG TPA: hypothetical protein P5072_13195, partial [Parvularculaceae bacterium]|nr:hypothetical protein [Parvularculaceae bacterium]
MSDTDMIRIAMWSGPRNISTTMMRSFENRPDTVVIDEPFYGCYLAETGADHPYREETLAARASRWEDVIESFKAPLPPGRSILFEKHIAYHYPDKEPLDWLLDHRTFLLIRDPKRMLASFSKKYEDVAPVIDSYRVERRIHEFLKAHGRPCPVVDAADVLANPKGVLGVLCEALKIPFTEKMLSWPAGARETDGPWAPHWYDAV